MDSTDLIKCILIVWIMWQFITWPPRNFSFKNLVSRIIPCSAYPNPIETQS